ncbi:Ankyrin repeat and KH domain-containing protein mask [Gryllus bimaculatus]|nr:Ankyrin repeat and KH domain-containing protein mask [Gryllus bimaculatus]
MSSGDEGATQPALGAYDDPDHEDCKYSIKAPGTSANGRSKPGNKASSDSAGANLSTSAQPSSTGAVPRAGTSAQRSSTGALPKAGTSAQRSSAVVISRAASRETLPPATNSPSLIPALLYTHTKCERCGFCIQLAEVTASHGCPPRSALSALRMAALAGDAEVVGELLAAGADPNERCCHKRSVLHCAAAAGFGDVVGVLLAAGADPSLPDERGRTPLHSASVAGHVAVAEQLVAAGAVVDAWPSRMLSREAEGSGRPTPSPSPPPAASARDEQLAAALVVASLHEPEMGADMSVSAKVLARKWWARTFNARRMQHWLRKRKNILL